MKTKYDIGQLLTDYLSDNLDEEGRQQLHAWEEESPQHAEILRLLKGESPFGPDVRRMYEYDEEKVWANLQAHAQHREKRRILRRLFTLASAASIAIALLFTGYYIYDHFRDKGLTNYIVSFVEPGHTGAILELSNGEQIDLSDSTLQQLTEADQTQLHIKDRQLEVVAPSKDAEPVFNTIRVPVGQEYFLILSDGTKVWLNSDSRITFPTQFTEKERHVSCEGEIYFEVAHDEKHPFTVSTHQMNLTVLGTSFNVMAYNDEPNVEATLISGSLKVEANDQEIILEPDRQARLVKSDSLLTVRKVYADSYAAWTKGVFVFFDEPVPSICRKLSRWYNIEIDASAEALQRIYFSGMIKRYDTFNKVADLLASTDELLFKEEEGRIIVYAKKDLL